VRTGADAGADGAAPAVPVVVGLVPEMAGAIGRDGLSALEDAIGARLRGELEALGIPGRPGVTCRRARAGRAITLTVNGNLRPYPPLALARAWLAVAEQGMRGLPSVRSGGGFPDQWLRAHASEVLAGRAEPGPLAAVVERLVVDLVREHPQDAFGDEQMDAYLPGAPADAGRREQWTRALRRLLELGAPLADRTVVLGALDRIGDGFDATEAAELACDRLRPLSLAVHAHPDTLARLAGAGARNRPMRATSEEAPIPVAERFGDTAERLRLRVGLPLPDIELVPDAGMPEDEVALAVCGRRGPPLPVVAAGRRAVDPDCERLRRGEVAAAGWTDPATGTRAALVEERGAARLEREGVETLTPLGHLQHLATTEVVRRASILASPEAVEERLAAMAEVYPELVASALAATPSAAIVVLLRELLEEGVPVANLRLILERLVELDTVVLDPDAYDVLDERLPVASAPRDPEAVRAARLRFVRQGLRPWLLGGPEPPRAVLVLRMDAELDARAAAAGRALGGPGMDPDAARLAQALRDATWAALARVDAERLAGLPQEGVESLPPAGHGSAPAVVLVTSEAARVPVRAALAGELPDLPVLSRSEMPPGVRRHEVGTVALRRRPAPAAA
jgi:hypothetical protein